MNRTNLTAIPHLLKFHDIFAPNKKNILESEEFIGDLSYVKTARKKVTRGNTVNYESVNQIYGLMEKFIPANEQSMIMKVNRVEFINEMKGDIKSIVNFYRINDIRMVNKFFEAVNDRLPSNGVFIGCVETANGRKKRILNKFPKVISYPYYTLDYILKRVFPKWKPTQKIYYFITKGRNRVISKAETLGRLVACGFEIINLTEISNLLFFVTKKIKKTVLEAESNSGPIITLERIGKNGKKINVYKFRTMHPYSEYIQDYMFENNNLKSGGKLKNDFRISGVGRLFRKYWIDELPMLINFFKGDMKLVGVRPLSDHYFSLYRKCLQEKRIKYKPGLIPPFYADLPKTLDEIMDSEERYLDSYEKNPLVTDFIYFFKVFRNIIIRSARSS